MNDADLAFPAERSMCATRCGSLTLLLMLAVSGARPTAGLQRVHIGRERFDANGIQTTVVGALPPQCAALNRACIAVQELTVHAALSGDRAAVYQAIALGPLTAGLLTLGQIHAMTAALLAAEARWLPARLR